jgi:hypothetical protein
MCSTPLLLEARPLVGYDVDVRFEDGTAGDVDADIAPETLYAHAQRRASAIA